MYYYSLNERAPKVTFQTALMQGLAPDGGLYFPVTLPRHDPAMLDSLKQSSLEELALVIMKPYVGKDISVSALLPILERTLAFPFPLAALTDKIDVLELFHGPTYAFKDVGALFMSGCLAYFQRNAHQKITILVATSGDTGGAVAQGFSGNDHVEVLIFYPEGKVSAIQELQLTRTATNVTALAINGSFDVCQSLVKQCLSDNELNRQYRFSSANSINVGRWLPQQLYYFRAFQQWDQQSDPVISVPSGNFGNLSAGMLAKASGLPVKQLIAACNANKVIPEFLEGSAYRPGPSRQTLSSAMDVGQPSNFRRMLALCNGSEKLLRESLRGQSVSDERTLQTMKRVREQSGYTLDPHTAVAVTALEDYLAAHPGCSGYALGTAHPVKFPGLPGLTDDAPLPDGLRALRQRPERKIAMEGDFVRIKEWMMAR